MDCFDNSIHIAECDCWTCNGWYICDIFIRKVYGIRYWMVKRSPGANNSRAFSLFYDEG